MDACLMNMVEVAYQLRESVNVIVGSEIEEPFDGWPYSEILNRLTVCPRQDAVTFARWIVKSYLASYKGKGETVTQSALDLGHIDDMMAKIDALSKAFLPPSRPTPSPSPPPGRGAPAFTMTTTLTSSASPSTSAMRLVPISGPRLSL